MVQRIRNEGNEAEQRFDELVATSQASAAEKLGDRIVTVDGVPSYIEIKRCTAHAGKSGTINQIRAIKYIPTVVWARERELWFVISPDILVELAAEKARGQHNEIPFECMNLSLPAEHSPTMEMWDRFRCVDDELDERVADAVREGRAHPEIESAMRGLHGELQALNARLQGHGQGELRETGLASSA